MTDQRESNKLAAKKQILAILGSALQFVGVFLPIVSVPILGSLNYFQNGKGDGSFILILAGISIVLALTRLFGGLWFTGGTSVALLLFTLFRFIHGLGTLREEVKSGISEDALFGKLASGLADTAFNSIQLQWGWAVLLLGSILVVVAAAIRIPEDSLMPFTSIRNLQTAYRFEQSGSSKFSSRLWIGVTVLVGLVVGLSAIPKFRRPFVTAFAKGSVRARTDHVAQGQLTRQAARRKRLTTHRTLPGNMSADHARWPAVTFLGFSGGESPEDAGAHAAALGLTQLVHCNARQSAGEFIDCKFSGLIGDSIEVSFFHGQLQRVDYRFGLNRYDEILEQLKKDYGRPRTLTDPHDSSDEISEEWGGYKDRFNISLLKTVGSEGQMDGAVAQVVFDALNE